MGSLHFFFNGNLRLEKLQGGDGWTDGLRWVDGRKNGRTNGWMDGSMDGHMEIHPCDQGIDPLGPLPKKERKKKMVKR